jgi:sugar phosphate isomerase/epimerase
MSKNAILFSTAVFLNSKSNHDHNLIIDMIPKLVSPNFELFLSSYFVDRQNEFDVFTQNILKTLEIGAHYPIMHVTQTIGDLISRNEDGDIEKALKLFEKNCEYAVKFRSKLLVLHLWGGLQSDKNIDINISTLPKLIEISNKYNLILTIENVVCNTYKPLDHLKKIWNIFGNTVKYTIDVRHAEFHKSLTETCESTFLWENNLVHHLHISDYGGGYMEWSKFLHNDTPITYGDVNFDYFFSFLKSIHYSGSITIENNKISENDDLVYNFNKAYEFIKKGLN